MKEELCNRIRTLIGVKLKQWALERDIKGLMNMTIDDFTPVYDACVTTDDPAELSKNDINEVIKALRANNH